MTNKGVVKSADPIVSVELVETSLTPADLHDLCDAAELSIDAGGGFGWLKAPDRDVMERHWQGVIAMPSRLLFLKRLDGVICGSCQLVFPPHNNEAQGHSAQLMSHFVAPWARGYGLSDKLLDLIESVARDRGVEVLNFDVRETMGSAIALYERHGFERIGEHPHYAKVDGRYVRGFYYTKLLNI